MRFWPKICGRTPKKRKFSTEVGSARLLQTCFQPLESKDTNLLASNFAFRLNRHTYKKKF